MIAAGPRRVLRRFGARRLGIVVVASVLVLGGGWFWLRDSSLVAVKRVTVTGLSGPNVAAMRSALVDDALTMTTLDYDVTKLQRSIASFPYVHSLTVSTSFPHEMTIAVVEHVPVAVISAGQRSVAVDSTGLLLGAPGGQALPRVPLRYQPGGDTVIAAGARAALAVLGAAPYSLLAHIQSATSSATHGVVVQMRNGPQLYFGTMQQIPQKWQAALGVLAEPHSVGAQYIDLSDPGRPAAGAFHADLYDPLKRHQQRRGSDRLNRRNPRKYWLYRGRVNLY